MHSGRAALKERNIQVWKIDEPEFVRLEAPVEHDRSPRAILLRYKEAELEIHVGTDRETIAAVLQAMKSI